MEGPSCSSLLQRIDTKFMLSAGITIGILLILMFAYISVSSENYVYSELEEKAEITFEQIVLTRQWNSDYGGVFVEKQEGLQSNPHLKTLGINPDILTVDGVTYTMKNPALMTREISYYANDSSFKFKITSLDPVNPSNAPTEKEREFLKQFENGSTNEHTILIANNSRYYHYMAPLYVKETCIKCHRDYREGDVRGGISVILPMDKQYADLQDEKRGLLLFAIFMIGSVEFLLFGITRKFVSNPVKKLKIGANEIANGNLSYRVKVESHDEIGELSNSFNSMASDLNVSLKKMEESNEWFSKIFENSYDAINISHNGITKYVNPAYVSLFKYDESDLIGKPLDMVLDHNSAANLKRYLGSISEKNNIHKRIEAIGYTKNSNEVFLDISLSSMEIKSETYLIAILKDITERKRAEEILLKNVELKRSSEFKDMFTDIMRHDLLNPVSAIQGYSQLLLDKEEDEQKKRFLKNITNSTKGLIEMIESASMLAKLENFEDLDFEHLDLGLIINEIVHSFKLELEKKQMDINLEMSGYYPVLANNMIGEVFRNLISNSIKYSPDGSTIIIKIVDENSYWKIEVVDEGEGISDEDKPYVFDRFTRVNKGNIKGTGLGLFIVKKIVDLHDGNVGVTDNPYGKGSLFFIRLKKIDTTI